MTLLSRDEEKDQPSTLGKGQEVLELGQPWPLAAEELPHSEMILSLLLLFYCLVQLISTR